MVKKPWESDECAALTARYSVYSIPKAAALWCGVSEEEIDTIVNECSQLSDSGIGRSIYVHPYISCIQPRSRFIAEAIENGVLPHGREDAKPVDKADHVAYERRHIFGRDLKDLIMRELPNEKPAFLFDPQERLIGSGITLQDYQTLEAANKALKSRVDQAIVEYTKLKNERDKLKAELDQITPQLDNEKKLNPRSELCHQRIIGALLSYIKGEIHGAEPHPSYKSDAALIALLSDMYQGYDGLSQSNLSRKFPEAKRSLEMK